MKNQIIRIKHQNGRYIVKGKGDCFTLRLSSGEIITGVMEPTFGYKLRRFLRRLGKLCGRAVERLNIFMAYTYHGETPPLTVEEMHRLHIHPDDRVMVLGASKNAETTKNACRTG